MKRRKELNEEALLILQPSVASPTSQLIFLNSRPFRRFFYVTDNYATLPSLYLRHNCSPTLPLLHLRHSSFSNPSFASPTSQALHLIFIWRATHGWKAGILPTKSRRRMGLFLLGYMPDKFYATLPENRYNFVERIGKQVQMTHPSYRRECEKTWWSLTVLRDI